MTNLWASITMGSLFTNVIVIIIAAGSVVDGYYLNQYSECGPYGFVCENNNRVRLCDDVKFVGPTFVCPVGTFCNQESTNVCENAINHIDPALTKIVRCRQNERIADPTVPGCKGYVLCVPNGGRFQGIKFKCSGNTVFNGYTRTCSTPLKYKCPLQNTTKNIGLFPHTVDNRKGTHGIEYKDQSNIGAIQKSPIECKNYKLRVTEDDSPDKATYFCPSRPVSGEQKVRCTIFSNNFCITLERDDQDQFIHDVGAAYRKPRTYE